jgi:predicted ATPase
LAVTRVSAVDSRFEALRTITTPMVGRNEEIEFLMQRWGQAKTGEGSVALISGEPGIGKSRIVQSVLERIKGERHLRLRYFCSPHHQDTALYPVIRQVEQAARFRREDTVEQRLEKLGRSSLSRPAISAKLSPCWHSCCLSPHAISIPL